ncbi:hypothetical protein I7I53_06960 [Histoplasma capsulatum var. duboisii H88]|uniref:Uncharacterized protein n=1 Tax=Ajellomyces capsulatus (strain H88) TaxID=544711 RepID=A0A8A1LII0_AJEC8|nr:hypothetical protein I7I53_06960 [Histoplasma capsulatum var. duboisii H88]
MAATQALRDRYLLWTTPSPTRMTTGPYRVTIQGLTPLLPVCSLTLTVTPTPTLAISAAAHRMLHRLTPMRTVRTCRMISLYLAARPARPSIMMTPTTLTELGSPAVLLRKIHITRLP